MTDKMIAMRHDVTGIVDEYPARYADHPVLGKHLEVVDEDVYCTDCVAPTAPSAVEFDGEPVVETADEPYEYDVLATDGEDTEIYK